MVFFTLINPDRLLRKISRAAFFNAEYSFSSIRLRLLILSGTLYSIKTITAVQRPDGSAYTAFPYGHTAEALASAEFLRKEYRDVSPWYGIAGYEIAATTGYLRVYDNKHWLSDVVAGAGVGIASTKLAYRLYPMISRKFFKNKEVNTLILPSYQNRRLSIGLVSNL